MKTKIYPVADFVSSHTEKMLARTKECIAETGGPYPVLSYIVNGREFSMPLDYEFMVRIGREMQDFSKSVGHMNTLGSWFGFMASSLAARAEHPLSAFEDAVRFMRDVEHALRHIAPQAFFVSMPVMLQTTRDPGDGPAIFVMGRNQVKSYGLLTPFYQNRSGEFRYGKPAVIDSMAGKNNWEGPFSGIYEPSRN